MPTGGEGSVKVGQDIDSLSAAYAKQVVDLLTEQLDTVIKARHPEILPLFQVEALIPENNKELLDLLNAHPVVLNGGTVELCETPKTS